MATFLDLTDLPPRLSDFEIDLLTDCLRRIIDRVGYITWQELPDNPSRHLPCAHFRHPIGDSTILSVEETPHDADGVAGQPVVRWLFTTETPRDPPPGLRDEAPLSRFFLLREWLREVDPRLIRRDILHENWQWFGLATLLVGGILLGMAERSDRASERGRVGCDAVAAPTATLAFDRRTGFAVRGSRTCCLGERHVDRSRCHDPRRDHHRTGHDGRGRRQVAL